MTKLTRKLFAILLTLTMILAPAGTAAIATGLPPITGDEIITDNYNELSIRSAVSAYFSQREAYLLGEAATIDNVHPGILDDEAKHRTAIFESDVQLSGTHVIINIVVYWDSYAEANVTETVTYIENSIENTEVIVHNLVLGQASDGRIIVIDDGYFELFSGFKSCSYVPPHAMNFDPNAITPGSSYCIVNVAIAEDGYTETGVYDTKYGEYVGMNYMTWCISFIAWCANEAGVSHSIIPKCSGTQTMYEFFLDRGTFYHRDSGYTPQPGDIYFILNANGGIQHGGIVTDVYDTYIYTVDGNWNRQVKKGNYLSRTANNLFGYAHPNYGASTHTYSICTYLNESTHRAKCAHCNAVRTESHSYGYDSWFYDSTNHWRECACGKHGTETAHSLSWQSNGTQHWRKCSTCAMTTTPAVHMYIQDSVTGMRKCRMCGAYENITTGIPPAIVIDR